MSVCIVCSAITDPADLVTGVCEECLLEAIGALKAEYEVGFAGVNERLDHIDGRVLRTELVLTQLEGQDSAQDVGRAREQRTKYAPRRW